MELVTKEQQNAVAARTAEKRLTGCIGGVSVTSVITFRGTRRICCYLLKVNAGYIAFGVTADGDLYRLMPGYTHVTKKSAIFDAFTASNSPEMTSY